MEIEIPIPSTSEGDPDWDLVRQAWWDAIDIIQASAKKGNYGCDMTLEMRVMGNSDITLAPYR